MSKKLDIEKINEIYDILVHIGGAHEFEREGFIYSHCISEHCCEEWRFCGKLGFGGKYRSLTNTVDCYIEDMNDERFAIINKINSELSLI